MEGNTRSNTQYYRDYTGIRRGPCLGCGQRVVPARDPNALFCGRRDGSLLFTFDVEPHLIQASDAVELYNNPGELYVLGVAHRECVQRAAKRVAAGNFTLPEPLIPLRIQPDDSPLPKLHLPPEPSVCAWCDRAEITEEHVFPKWISEELARYPLVIQTAHGLESIRVIDVTAPVCALCNNRWLSVLEKDVQPILAA